jgi:uncharacterized membrane protein YdjX (TVP38/TMEM64 family)
VLAALLLRNETVRTYLIDIDEISAALHPEGSLLERLRAYGIFIAASVVLMTMGLPRVWVCAVAGGVFGMAVGIPLALVASLLGVTGTYMVGRSLLSSMVKRRLKGRVKVWKERFQENAFFWTLYARLFPLSNSTMTSLLCGCCRVPMKSYVAANAIGFLPMTITIATLGDGAAEGSKLQLLLGVLFLAASFAASRLFKKRAAQRRPLDEEPADA